MVADTVPPRSRPRVRGCFAFSDAYFHGLGIAAAGQAAQSQPSSRLSKGSRRLFLHTQRPAEAALGLRDNKGSCRRIQPARWRRRAGSGREVQSRLLSETRVGKVGNRTTGKSEAWALSRAAAGPGGLRWCLSAADTRDCSIPPPRPRTVPRAAWWRWSRLAPLHSQVTRKKKEEKVGEADARRKINRDKREEGGVADQPFLSYGVPAGTAKERKKKKKKARA